jgi:hypothetical protein
VHEDDPRQQSLNDRAGSMDIPVYNLTMAEIGQLQIGPDSGLRGPVDLC